MEFHKPKFRKNTYSGTRYNNSSGYRGPRDNNSSGYRGQRNDRSSGYKGPRDNNSSGYRGQRNDRSSGYNQGLTRFQRDRTPIYSRDNFRTTKYPPNRDESYRKNSRDYNSNSFYSTLRTKLFAVLGEKKCVNCGFDDERALGFGQTDDVASFDYIQRAGTASSWEKYISDPDLAKKKLQVICLNCNMVKQKELE